MHRWMPPCHLRSAPPCPTVRRHSSFCGFLAAVSSVKASWSRPRRRRMRLHLVPQSASVQKILRFGYLSCPAFWLSFSASGHSGFWKYHGHFLPLFRPRSTPVCLHCRPRIGRFPGAPQTGRHGQRTSPASAPYSTGSVRPGSVPPCRTAGAGFFRRSFLHRFSVSSFWAPTAPPWLFSEENGSFLRTILL